MTNKQIKAESIKILSEKSGDCISLMIFTTSIVAFIFLCEIVTYLVLKNLGWEWIYDITLFFSNKIVACYWILKISVLAPLLMTEFSVIRRMFIDSVLGDGYISTRQYISAHSLNFYSHAFFNAVIYYFIKFVTAVPGFICLYSIYYWVWICRLNTLTSSGLFAFMMSIGFSLIYSGFYFHYCISISLTPYIMALNPRTNVFDACDLSVKLMEGNHSRYISYLLSFVKYLPALVFVCPFFAIFPYFKTGYILLVRDIMGNYWQDKMPGMVKRWKKYL